MSIMIFFNAANSIVSNYIKQSLQNARRNEQKQKLWKKTSPYLCQFMEK